MLNNFSVYKGRDLQHAMQIMTRCGEAGLSLEQCLAAVKKGYSDTRPLQQPGTAKDRCPGCGKSSLVTMPVNSCPATQVGGDYSAVRICKGCKHEEWVR